MYVAQVHLDGDADLASPFPSAMNGLSSY